MKKIAIAIGFIALVAGPVCAAPFLKLDKPNGGEPLTLGTTYKISWTAREVTQNVALVLLQNGDRVGIIAGSLAPGSSPFKWTVGRLSTGTAGPGGGFTVRVRTLDSSLRDESDGPFTIGAAPSDGEPDFQVSHMGCSPRVKDGAVQSVVVQLYVKNNGAEYNGPLSVHYICLDSLVHSKISLDQVITLPSVSIPHGQWYGFVLCQPAWPAGVKAIHFGVMLDPGNLVNETNESNNYINYSYTLPPLDEIPQI